jgi:GNAT superfamily N-acetyltransferase
MDYNRLISQWDWKYEANPFNFFADPDILLLKNGNDIIGMEGTMSLRVSILGKEYWIKNFCDLVIHPDYRGQGLSRKITKQFIVDHPMGFSWLNEISQKTVAPLSTSRYTRLLFLFRLIDPSQVIYKTTGNRFLRYWGSLITSATHHFAYLLHRRPSSTKLTVSQVTTFDYRVNSLWKRASRNYPVIIVRDQSYLNWRFVHRPDAKYILFTATRGDDLVGFIVLRVIEKFGLKCGYLTDFLVENRSSSLLKYLLYEAIDFLRHEGTAIIICLATMHFFRHTFYHMGFIPWRLKAKFFSPRLNSSDPELQIFRISRQWYLTMGDGDLEMSF